MKLVKVFALILAMIIFVLPMSAFAAAETLPAGYTGNSSSLITVRNPAALSSSTTSKICVISAIAVPGTKVTLYNYDSAKGCYTKMYSGGKALESVVGAAGLYAQSIYLKSGTNTILVAASYGNSVETVRLDVNVVKN